MKPLALYQIAVICIATLMLLQGTAAYLQKEAGQTFLKFFLRIIVWGGMIIVVTFPKTTFVLAKIFGIEGNINAVILSGFILVFLVLFKLLSTLERLEHQITALVRNEALKDISHRK